MTENITVTVEGKGEYTIKKGTTYEQLAKQFCKEFSSEIVVAKWGNQIRELCHVVELGKPISFMDITDVEGMRVYYRSVSMLLIKAVKDVLGIETEIIIENSLKKNYYCEMKTNCDKLTEEILNKIENRMKELVKENIPFVKETLPREKAVFLMRKNGLEDKVKLFHYRRASTINLYRLDDFYDYYYGYMVPSTGYLKFFHLSLYQNGFLLLFPLRSNPNVISKVTHLDKIYNVFMEQKDWCELMQVRQVSELNDCIVNGEFWNLVRVNEALHEKKIAMIADAITERKQDVKVVLIAGPSSSGKTTFAQRLCVQLRVNGIIPHVISLDNYFIDRDKTPLDEFGKHDFENINALDVELFNHDLKKMIEGETIQMPIYNFLTGKREYKGNYCKLNQGEIFVIEGIHGLNDELTKSIEHKNKYKIFISAMTQLNVDNHNCISTSDSRLLRRIVRDNQFRGNNAAATIDAWPYVTRGEANNIFPFQENADIIFNSATIYELSILKPYAEPLLFHITEQMPEYITAKRLIKFLNYFLAVGTEQLPNNSIMREFVGGSCFHV